MKMAKTIKTVALVVMALIAGGAVAGAADLGWFQLSETIVHLNATGDSAEQARVAVAALAKGKAGDEAAQVAGVVRNLDSMVVFTREPRNFATPDVKKAILEGVEKARFAVVQRDFAEGARLLATLKKLIAKEVARLEKLFEESQVPGGPMLPVGN